MSLPGSFAPNGKLQIQVQFPIFSRRLEIAARWHFNSRANKNVLFSKEYLMLSTVAYNDFCTVGFYGVEMVESRGILQIVQHTF